MNSRDKALNTTYEQLTEIHASLCYFETDNILNKIRALIEPAIVECDQELERIENDLFVEYEQTQNDTSQC